MKSMPDAEENRRKGKIENDKADKLRPGKDQDALRKKAREHESEAHSSDWRHSNLHKPD
ncbi:MAG: hypothetical protein ABI150_04915 [Nitrobacter sp.]|mgnify:CR=1 FL=1|jgi:hypothetical protein